MLKNIRVGSSLFILHKNEPRLEVAEVRKVEPLPPQFSMNYQNGVPFQQQKNFVNIATKVGDSEINLNQVEADADVCDCNGIVIAESREALLPEVYALQSSSRGIIESLPKHEAVVASCDEIIAQLKPELKREAERDREIETLRDNLSCLSDDMNEIKTMLTRVLKSTSKKE